MGGPSRAIRTQQGRVSSATQTRAGELWTHTCRSHAARRACALPQREGTMWGNEPGRNMLQLAVHGQRGWKPGVVPRRPCSPACRPHGGILWDRSCSPSEARPAWQVCGGDGWTGSRARSVCAYGTPPHGDTCVLGPDSPGLTDPQEHPAKARQRPITFDRGDPGAVEG